MGKSIHRDDYNALIELLRRRRREAGVTQIDLSKALRRSQSFVSDIERGQRRLDVIEVRDICAAIGTSFLEFIREFDALAPRVRATRRHR